MTKRFSLLFALLAIIGLFPMNQADAVAWNDIAAGNPVLPGYFADPCCRKFGDTYYLYVTPDGWDVGRGPFAIWTSKDFVNWTAHKSPGIKPGTFWPSTEFKWAPSVVFHNGKYYMYNQVPCMIWGAVSDTPLGPWKSLSADGVPMIPDATPKGSIVLDGEMFIDDDNQLYMWYSTWWTPTVAKMKQDMCTIDGTPIQYFKKGENETPMGLVQGCMEAPYMFKRKGIYYLMYSNNFCQNTTYCVEYSTSTSPTGPFTYGANNPILSTNDDGSVAGPGHHTMLEDGGKIYIVYHRHNNPHFADGAHRQTAIDELRFNADGSIQKVVPSHVGVGYLAPSTVRDTNMALGKSMTASSSAGPDFRPSYAMDANNGTLWKSSVYKYPQWVQVDLGKAQKLDRVVTEFQFAQVGYAYTLESSTDGKTWKKYADRTKNSEWGPMIDKGKTTARYIKMTLLGDDSSSRPNPEIGIWNIKVYDGIIKPNQAPKVNAGADKSASSSFLTLPLIGAVTDDGLPNGPVSTIWKKVSGPGKVIFQNADRRETTVTFPGEGKFVLKLIANDGKLASSDTVTYTIKPLGDKLVYYKFDDRGNVAIDVSGNLQDGFFKNQAGRGTGVFGTALNLNGTNNYVAVPALGESAKLAIAAWVKLDSMSNLSSIVSANSNSGGRQGAGRGNSTLTSSGFPKLAIIGTGEIQFSVSGCNPSEQKSDYKFNEKTLGRWTHVAAIYDSAAKSVSFYVDGKFDSTRTYTQTQNAIMTAGLRIGATENGNYFDGKIDELLISNKAMTANQIASLTSGAVWTKIGDALKMADGKPVTLKAKTITYAPRDSSDKRTTKYFYIAEPDNSAMLRVEDGQTGQDNADAELGATLKGIMRKSTVTGERYLELTAPLEVESSQPVYPVKPDNSKVQHLRRYDGILISLEGKVKSIASDRMSLVMTSGNIMSSARTAPFTTAITGKIIVKSENAPISLVEVGNTISVLGVVGISDGVTRAIMLRSVRILDPAIPPITDGLIAAYNLDQTSGSTAADWSGKGNDAAVNGPTWTSGKLGNAANFNGRDGQITLPQGIMKDINDFTICTWVKLDVDPTFSRIFDFGSGTPKYMMFCNLGEGRFRYAITVKGNGEDGEKVCDTSDRLPIGCWRHIAITQTGHAVNIYIDGKKAAETDNIRLKPSDLGETTNNWIGRSQYGDPLLDGKVDDFRIYNRALKENEITQIYNGY